MKSCNSTMSTLISIIAEMASKSSKLSPSTCDSSSRFIREYVAREVNVILWLSLIAITVFLLGKYVKLFKLWIQASKIPGPPCPSFLGHSKIISPGNLIDLLSNTHEKYGSVVKLWLGPTQLLVSMKDPILIKEVLQKAEDKLPLTGKTFRLAFGHSSLFASSFDKVQDRRESLATELDGRLLQRSNKLPARVVDCIMERLNGIVRKRSISCKEVSQHMAFTILGATLFGDAFLAWSKAAVYEDLLMMIPKDACFWASYGVTPFWKQGFWKYQHLCTKLKCLTQDIIQQCKKNCRFFDHEGPSSNYDMEKSFCGSSCSGISTQYNLFFEANSHTNLKDELCGNMMGVMFHGCSTTAGLVANILTRLANHKEIQDKIYSEITEIQKGSSKQNEHNVDKMVLLMATIYESARLLPAGPLLQRCSLKHDLKLKSGVTIPAGAVVVVPLQLVQMDNSSWGNDSTVFNPYRFLTNPENRSKFVDGAEELVNQKQRLFVLNDPNKNGAFLPFGSGARACVGQKFVIQGVATLFASLLERYEVRLQTDSENTKPKMDDYAFQLNQSPQVVFIKR